MYVKVTERVIHGGRCWRVGEQEIPDEIAAYLINRGFAFAVGQVQEAERAEPVEAEQRIEPKIPTRRRRRKAAAADD